MKKSEIRVGGTYLAKVGSAITTVRVDKIRDNVAFKGGCMYDVTNLRTGHRATFSSAAKFRGSVPEPKPVEEQPDNLGFDQHGVPVKESYENHSMVIPNLVNEQNIPKEDDIQCPFVEPTSTTGAGASTPSPTHTEGEQSLPPPATTSAPTTPPTESPATSAQSAEETPSATTSAPTTVPASSTIAGRIAAAKRGRSAGTPVAGMVPNEEQEAIIEIAEAMGLGARMEGNVLVIAAGAGTGKTATLKMLEQILRGRGQYTAFNASLVAESKSKFTKCAVNTTHSLAFHAVGKLYAHRLGGERMRSGQVAQILGIQSITITLRGQGPLDGEGKATDKVKTLRPEFLAGQVMVAIRRFCQSADSGISEDHFKYIDGIDAPTSDGKRGRENNDLVRDWLVAHALKAWEDLSKVDGQLPFSHDCYVKIWSLGQGDDRPIIASDYILLDEAQDTAPVFLDVLRAQRHALLVLVGDDNQQIYEWRGAVNAMGAFPGAPRRLLSQSYRFGQAIADVANTILATLDEPSDLVMRGMPSLPSRVAPVNEPRCYLYRTNAGAVARVMAAVAEGKRPHLIGGGSDVVAWCEAAIDLQAKRGTRHPELCCFDTWQEVEEYSKTDEGSDLKLMVKLVNQFSAEEIRDALRGMPKEQDADLVVSTAHKSKGREWDTVRLGPDFPTANRMQDSDRRLLYVACTRAKLTLDLSECPPFCGGDEQAWGEGGSETRWVPGLRVTYTKPMPSQEDQDEWVEAQKSRAEKSPTRPAAAPETPAPMPPGPTPPDAAGADVASLPAVPVPVPVAKPLNGNGTFTWTKFDGGWFVRGPAGTPVNTKVTVVRKDGSESTVTIRVVKHRFSDAWVYGV